MSLLSVIFLVFLFTGALGLQVPPPSFNCRGVISQRGIVDLPGTDESVYCMNQYFYHVALKKQSTSIKNVTTSQLYIHELLNRAFRRCSNRRNEENCLFRRSKTRVNSRRCHTASFGRHNRVNRCRYWTRNEVRVMSAREWKRFVDRVNILKRPINITGGGSFIPYDIISDIHMPAANLEAAHEGPNFLGWHRIYLLVMESALNVPIPYWDSRLDFNMADPTASILWTPRYFGTGRGLVSDGPFSNWITPLGSVLCRSIGNSELLITDSQLEELMKFNRHNPIVYPSDDITIEEVHNEPHVWVGGQLSFLETASQDPVFFLHHAFVDYIWYLFRENMRRQNKFDPEEDYPEKGPQSQRSYEQMIPFNFYLDNIDGYSNFVESLVTYQRSPTCPRCYGRPHLVCNRSKWRCQSTRMPEKAVKSMANVINARLTCSNTFKNIKMGKTFSLKGLALKTSSRNKNI